MADNITTTTDINPAVQTYYDRVLLTRAKPFLIHEVASQSRNMKRKSGDQIKFRRYSSLTPATTPLTEGTNPPGQKMSKTDIVTSIQEYGDYIKLTDWVDLTNQDPVLTEAAELLGEQMGQTRDILVRDVLTACASIIDFAGGTLPANETKLKTAIRTLASNNAQPITKLIRPGTGVGTMPVAPAYWGLSHTDLMDDWDSLSDWLPVQKYPHPEQSHEAEIGAYKRIRVLTSSLGATDGTNYHVPVVGQNAYGTTSIEGTVQNIVKAFGSAGSADPLNMLGSSGWKMTFAATILNDNFMLVLKNIAHS